MRTPKDSTIKMLNIEALGIPLQTKIINIIYKFLPCSICGNSDPGNFIVRLRIDGGKTPGLSVKCQECETDLAHEMKIAKKTTPN